MDEKRWETGRGVSRGERVRVNGEEATAQLGFAESLLIDCRQRCESTAEPKARSARSFELRFTSVADVVGARIIRAHHIWSLSCDRLSATSNYKKLVSSLGLKLRGCLAHLGGNIRAARAQSFRCAARELRRQGGQTACAIVVALCTKSG